MKTIIIGGVAGGASTAARLRRIDENAEIILFERGRYISYANCGLPYYIGGVISEREQLFIQTVEGFSTRFNVDVRVQSEVLKINPQDKTVEVRNLLTDKVYIETYDKLVVSTGAEPIKPPIKGIDNERIFSLRSVPDTDKIKNYIDRYRPKRALVVGGGFIGLEMVENLREKGLEVAVVEKSNQVMGPLDYSMASIVHRELENKGVNLYLNRAVKEFQAEGDQVRTVFEDKDSLTADIVIFSIGVKPETKLIKEAGLKLGNLGGIEVNEYMQTSDKDVYALGDAVEVFNPVINQRSLIPLAGPANKQGRIVADNIVEGNTHKYNGTIGTSIAKVFDLTVAATGASSKLLDRVNIPHISSFTHGSSHAGYYPGAMPLSIKINFSPVDGKLLGAQVVGVDGADKRIEMFAQVIKKGGSIYDLQEMEHAYAPPYSSAKDPVNIAGFVAENILTKKMNIIHFDEIEKSNTETIIVDVRTTAEYAMGHINGAVNIPVDELRNRLNEIPTDKKIVVYCAVGLRGHLASRILIQNGYKDVFNLSGGYRTYSYINTTVKKDKPIYMANTDKESNTNTETISIDACGLQCPGPIMKLKEKYDQINDGDRLEIKVTDQSFGEDLTGWCRMVGAELIGMDNSKGVITAEIEKRKKDSTANSSSEVKDNKTLIVFSDDLDKALATFVIANGAVASGKKVSIFFTFWGLNVIKKMKKEKAEKDFIGKLFGMMLPSSSKKLGLSKMNMGGLGGKMMRYIMKRKNIESLENLMQQAIDNKVEFIACSMSMDVMGIKKEELIDDITIGGVAAYLDRAEKANVNLFI